jgi:hypothetical protein
MAWGDFGGGGPGVGGEKRKVAIYFAQRDDVVYHVEKKRVWMKGERGKEEREGKEKGSRMLREIVEEVLD